MSFAEAVAVLQSNHVDYETIPRDTIAAITRYVEQGIPPGGFVQSVLENDLAGAIGRADVWNMRALKSTVSYVYNEIPAPAWGSKEKYAAWLERFEKEKSHE